MREECLPISFTVEGFNLCGELTFTNASMVLKKASVHFDDIESDTIIIDLSKLEKIDSAGIALLLAWERLSKNNNKKLQLKNAQEQAISLIKTNKLLSVLNISS